MLRSAASFSAAFWRRKGTVLDTRKQPAFPCGLSYPPGLPAAGSGASIAVRSSLEGERRTEAGRQAGAAAGEAGQQAAAAGHRVAQQQADRQRQTAGAYSRQRQAEAGSSSSRAEPAGSKQQSSRSRGSSRGAPHAWASGFGHRQRKSKERQWLSPSLPLQHRTQRHQSLVQQQRHCMKRRRLSPPASPPPFHLQNLRTAASFSTTSVWSPVAPPVSSPSPLSPVPSAGRLICLPLSISLSL